MSHYDVAIIGAGPAGLAAGLTLLQRPGTRVVLLDKHTNYTLRPGESLSPGTRPLLEYLGVWKDFSQDTALPTYSSQAAWGSEKLSSLDYLLTIHGNGWALDRHRFDNLLCKHYLQRGGELLASHSVDAIKPAQPTQIPSMPNAPKNEDAHWIISAQGASGPKTINARYIIDASGRSGRIAKWLGGTKKRHDRLMGFTCIGENIAGAEATIMVEAGRYGWWYSTPLPKNRRATVFMTDSDIGNSIGIKSFAVWHAQLQGTRHVQQKAKFTNDTQVSIHPAYSSELVGVSATQHWVAVGDAAASFDPLSSTGIPHALASGIQGARVAANSLFDNGQMFSHYQKCIADDYHDYLNTRWDYYNREKRWERETFWRRRQLKVTLDPMTVIPDIHNCAVNRASFLSPHLQTKLTQECQPGLKAYQVAERFRRNHPEVPDEHIITAVQLMMAEMETAAV